MNIYDTIRKLDRAQRLVYLVGKLSLLAGDDAPEYDSLIDRIIKRLDHYESKTARL